MLRINGRGSFIKIAEVLNVDITPGDIEISLKRKRRDKTTIIVKFMNHKIKTKLYKERIKLKNIALTDLYPSYASSVNPERIISMRISLVDDDAWWELQTGYVKTTFLSVSGL